MGQAGTRRGCERSNFRDLAEHGYGVGVAGECLRGRVGRVDVIPRRTLEIRRGETLRLIPCVHTTATVLFLPDCSRSAPLFISCIY